MKRTFIIVSILFLAFIVVAITIIAPLTRYTSVTSYNTEVYDYLDQVVSNSGDIESIDKHVCLRYKESIHKTCERINIDYDTYIFRITFEERDDSIYKIDRLEYWRIESETSWKLVKVEERHMCRRSGIQNLFWNNLSCN
jgi:hypothetical protein